MKIGDRVIDKSAGPGRAATGKVGTVISLTLPNPPWHDGGRPLVQPDDGGAPSYWHYAEVIT